jgi:transcriptional antiterminator
MPKRQSKTSEKYEDWEGKIASALKDLEEHPDAKIKHVAHHYGLNRNTLHNQLKGKHKPAREAHPESAALTKEEEDEVTPWGWVQSTGGCARWWSL